MILWEDEDSFAFPLTSRIRTTLERFRLFLPDQEKQAVANRSWRVQPYVSLHAGRHIPDIGSFSYSHSSGLDRHMVIGRYCSIAAGVWPFGPEHPTHWAVMSELAFQPSRGAMAARSDRGKPIETAHHRYASPPLPIIGNDVWIGQNAQLKRGIRVGDGAVIGAGAVVTKDVQSYSIVGGVPARIIRYRFDDALIMRFQAVRWWDFREPDLMDLGYEDPPRFLDNLENAIAAGRIKRWNPQYPYLYDIVRNASRVKSAEPPVAGSPHS